MDISNNLKIRINELIKDDKLRKRLLNLEPKAIGEIGSISQVRIDPKDVVESYENDTVYNLYKKARCYMELNKLYLDLCNEYAKSLQMKESLEEER